MVSWVSAGRCCLASRAMIPEAAGRWLITRIPDREPFRRHRGRLVERVDSGMVPHRIRGKFFGRRNAILQISTLTFLLVVRLVAGALGLWHRDLSGTDRGGGLPARLAPLAVISPTGTVQRCGRNCCAKLREQFALVLGFALAAGLGVRRSLVVCGELLWPVLPRVHVRSARCRRSRSAISVLAQLTGALAADLGPPADRFATSRSWRSASRCGRRRILVRAQAGQIHWLLYPMWMAARRARASSLGQFTLLLKLIPAEAKNLAIGSTQAVTFARRQALRALSRCAVFH